jgi:hypothetical protein
MGSLYVEHCGGGIDGHSQPEFLIGYAVVAGIGLLVSGVSLLRLHGRARYQRHEQ